MCVNKLDYRTETLDSKTSSVKICTFCVLHSPVHMTHLGLWFYERHSANINALLLLETCFCFTHVIRSVSAECLCAGRVSVGTFPSI